MISQSVPRAGWGVKVVVQYFQAVQCNTEGRGLSQLRYSLDRQPVSYPHFHPVNLTTCVLDCERKLENPQGHEENMQSPHRKAPANQEVHTKNHLAVKWNIILYKGPALAYYNNKWKLKKKNLLDYELYSQFILNNSFYASMKSVIF